MRQFKHPAHKERRWVIELADQTRLSLPLSWLTPIADPSQAPTGEEIALEEELWADTEALLTLARMVRKVRTDQLEKEGRHEVSAHSDLASGRASREAEPGGRLAASMGTVAAGIPTGTGAGSERSASQATTLHNQRTKGTPR
ncbi:MAG: hypothetical protein ACRD4B_02075 [Acidobacteriota bacterium]